MGVVGAPGQTVYSSTKSGLIGLTKSLSLELTKNKVRELLKPRSNQRK